MHASCRFHTCHGSSSRRLSALKASMSMRVNMSIDVSIDISMDLPIDVSSTCTQYTTTNPRDMRGRARALCGARCNRQLQRSHMRNRLTGRIQTPVALTSEQATEVDLEAAEAAFGEEHDQSPEGEHDQFPEEEHDQSPEEEQRPAPGAIAAQVQSLAPHVSSAQGGGGGKAPRVPPLDFSRVQRHSCEKPPCAPILQRLRPPHSPRVEIWLHEHHSGLAGVSCEGCGARGRRGRSTSEDSSGIWWDEEATGGVSDLVSTLSAEEKHDALQRLQAALRW